MDAAHILKRISLFLAAGLLIATTGQAATLQANNSQAVQTILTGSIQSQNLNVTSSDGTALTFGVVTPITYTGVQPLGFPNWLSANVIGCSGNTSCATPATLSLSLTNDLAQWGSGPFGATVTLTPGNGTANVTISVTFFPGFGGQLGFLTVTPSALNPVYVAPLSYATIQPVPTQQVLVTGTTSYMASASTLSGGSWLLLNVGGANGTQIPSTPSSQLLNITVDPSVAGTLAAAVYEGFVILTGADGTSIATIDVNLAVNGAINGAVTCTPAQMTFSWSTAVSPLAVPPQTIVVSTPIGSSFTASADQPWIQFPAQSTGAIPGNLQVFVNPSQISTLGTYTGHVTITSASISQSVTVQLVVSNSAVVWARTPNGGGSALFTAQGSVSTPTSQAVSFITSDGSIPAFTVLSSPSWASASLSGDLLTITPTVSGIVPAIFSDVVVVSATGVSNSPLSVPVVLVANGGGASGPLTLNPSSLNFTALAGGTTSSPQTLTVSSPTAIPFNVSTSTSNGIPWLVVSPMNSATNSSLTVSVLPALLSGSAIPYNGTITLSIPNTTQSQTVPVALTVAPTGGGNVKIDNTAVSLTAQTGTLRQAATISVSNVAAGTPPILFNVTTTPSATWLKATPSQAATQSTVTITADPTGLAANTYAGQVTITPTGGNPVNVNVTFTVQGQSVISASQTSFTFTYLAGGDVPAAQTVQISGGSFTAAVTAGSDWLSVSPLSGAATTNLAISVKPAAQSSGSHSGVITVTGANNTVTINVTLNVTLPLPTINSVLNGASLQPSAIAGGEVISLYGLGLGPAVPVSAQFSGVSLATSLAGVRLFINGFPAPLIYVSSTQITAVVPYEIAQFQQATVQVNYLNQGSNITNVAVANTSPAIFTLNSTGTGAAARNADFSPNGSNHPAPRGSTVILFITGEGPLLPPGMTGVINPTTGSVGVALLQVFVLIDNQPANWTYAGGIPGVVEGITRLDVQIPPNARSGDLPVRVIIGGNGSQVSTGSAPPVTVSVQ